MSQLHVDIVTPERLVFSGEATEVRAPGWNGQFGALGGHTVTLSLLRAGLVTVITADQQRLVVGRGFAEIGPDRVTLLVDHCEDAAGADKSAAQTALQEATAQLGQAAEGSGTWDAAEEQMELAMALLST